MGGAQGNSLPAKISDKILCPGLKKRAQEILSTLSFLHFLANSCFYSILLSESGMGGKTRLAALPTPHVMRQVHLEKWWKSGGSLRCFPEL